jgi:uncharacterized protein (TIGR03067 family)
MRRLRPNEAPGARAGPGLSPGALIRRLEDCWDEPGCGGRPDAEILQGAWESVAGERPAELLVAGNRFAVRFRDGPVYMGDFALEPDVEPKTIVMRIEEGPAHHRGKCARCLYDLDGHTLRWWLPEPGMSEQPTTLPGAGDPRYLYMTLHHVGPAEA